MNSNSRHSWLVPMGYLLSGPIVALLALGYLMITDNYQDYFIFFDQILGFIGATSLVLFFLFIATPIFWFGTKAIYQWEDIKKSKLSDHFRQCGFWYLIAFHFGLQLVIQYQNYRGGLWYGLQGVFFLILVYAICINAIFLINRARLFGKFENKLANKFVDKSSDEYEILRINKTDGVNFGLDTKDIIEQLKIWKKDFEFHIVEAKFDHMIMILDTLPKDMNKFALEVIKFCPDTVDIILDELPMDASESVKLAALVEIIKNEKALYFWWD